jgi:hypothetical protein
MRMTVGRFQTGISKLSPKYRLGIASEDFAT